MAKVRRRRISLLFDFPTRTGMPMETCIPFLGISRPGRGFFFFFSSFSFLFLSSLLLTFHPPPTPPCKRDLLFRGQRWRFHGLQVRFSVQHVCVCVCDGMVTRFPAWSAPALLGPPRAAIQSPKKEGLGVLERTASEHNEGQMLETRTMRVLGKRLLGISGGLTIEIESTRGVPSPRRIWMYIKVQVT